MNKMTKSLKDALDDLGYEVWPSQYPNKKRIMKDGQLIESMSVGEAWDFLRYKHPEYFKAAK